MDLEASPDAAQPTRPDQPGRRRRGRELEDALLDSAWLELIEKGYGSFTVDAVAERAGTSRPVLYRRWPDRQSLALAAIQHVFDRSERPDFDTGSLRGDLIAYLSHANQTRMEFAAVVSTQLGTYYRDTSSSLADLRRVLIGERATQSDVIMARAVARGEIDESRLTPRVVSVPFDLFRSEAMMTMRPVPDSVIHEIVDDIFLPLVSKPPVSKTLVSTPTVSGTT
ncbi:TetR/AcrR family transcriptional regulator [Subtercola sp. YIM 133946]|uniref:TetR/AcrR family transcriptional regulator n=1 Tax=Subtercola sp. YIM 133946 TaxID=3118909 RepID=UPI002F93593E